MSISTKIKVSQRTKSTQPDAVLNSSVLDRMMDTMVHPFMNGRRAESMKNGRKVHPGAFVFGISIVFLLSVPIFFHSADQKHEIIVYPRVTLENQNHK